MEDMSLHQKNRKENNEVQRVPIEDDRRGKSSRLDIPGTTSDRRGSSVQGDISNG